MPQGKAVLPALPVWLTRSWAGVLVIAWAAKLCGDPGYW